MGVESHECSSMEHGVAMRAGYKKGMQTRTASSFSSARADLWWGNGADAGTMVAVSDEIVMTSRTRSCGIEGRWEPRGAWCPGGIEGRDAGRVPEQAVVVCGWTR